MDNNSVHYDAVRRALENGNAAIMVGAGFSRNAENGDQLAMWHEVANELWRELNPDMGELENSSASVVTQLGEQYARVFSKPALEDLLKRLIPDERVSPGILHKKLLTLPWCEIFTTNYDTLLERASENIVDHAHYVVASREDIPQSKMLGRRRIVKLHGSFPSQRPFIFTEEDYRRYPDLAAPFVNLVRQSILENVFCLIGFSGDDPNFLHWIGWVRDVLDQHALPIYLFLGSAPTLGQQRLLESRRVTPVVLPMIDGVDASEYALRYSELFRILGEPFTQDVKNWGRRLNISSVALNMTDTLEKKRKALIKAYVEVREFRVSYPGWFVAPHSVRKDFSSTLQRLPRFINSKDIQEDFKALYPHVGVAILAEYSWHNDVLLRCFDDRLAEYAIELLVLTRGNKYKSALSEYEDLKCFDIKSHAQFSDRWKELGIALLRWARQELRQVEYDELSARLLEAFPNDLMLHDELVHEAILLALYRGDRDIAGKLLNDWEVKSPDGYMFVRKGMLLGEVGDVASGLVISLVGLKKLRKNQRSRTSSISYLSQEAWACLAIGYLQKTLKWSIRFGGGEEDVNFDVNEEELNQRLADLASIGHDVTQDLDHLTADLNAEAPPPSQPVSYTPLFEIGRYSTTRNLGGRHSFGPKIDAAFAWLSLSDRVSLVPRVGDVTFDIGSFAQAAWWAQYADSMERILSVMIRALNKKMLNPRNPNQLLHSAGWLSRYQVARTKEQLAEEMCERSLSLVERMLDSTSDNDELVRIIAFHLEMVGRLVIRIRKDEVVFSIMERVISLHGSKVILRNEETWKCLANCMSRCFESLPPYQRRKMSSVIAMIPFAPENHALRNRGVTDWIGFNSLQRQEDDLELKVLPPEVSQATDVLIQWLKTYNSEDPSLFAKAGFSIEALWQRLFWLKEWGFIAKAQLDVVNGFLIDQKPWPILPGHHYWSAISWMSNERKAADQAFKKWLLSREVTRFRADPTASVVVGARVSWSLNYADEFLINWHQSLVRYKWSEKDLIKGFKIVKAWWDEEWPFIENDIEAITDLKALLVGRLRNLDRIIAIFIDEYGVEKFSSYEDICSWASDVRKKTKVFGADFFRTRIAFAYCMSKKADLIEVESELVRELFGADIPGANYAVGIIYYWARHDKVENHPRPSGMLYALAGIISARRLPALPWALEVMTFIASLRPSWIDETCYGLIEVGMSLMLEELKYEDRPDATGIPDDTVPTLRLGCLKLALELSKGLAKSCDSCNSWIKQAQTDPLPEMRFLSVLSTGDINF